MRAVTDEPDDASDELPWQVIGIRDEERLESLRRQAQQHAARTARAADRRREALAPPPPSAPSREDGPPDGEAAIESPEGLGEMVESGDLKGAAAPSPPPPPRPATVDRRGPSRARLPPLPQAARLRLGHERSRRRAAPLSALPCRLVRACAHPRRCP